MPDLPSWLAAVRKRLAQPLAIGGGTIAMRQEVLEVVRFVCPVCQREQGGLSAVECDCGAYLCSQACRAAHQARHAQRGTPCRGNDAS